MKNSTHTTSCISSFTTSALAVSIALPALGFASETITRVETIPLSAALVDVKQSAPAVVVSLNEGVISAQINAQVSQVHKQVGDSVSKNDLLVTLDCRETRQRQAIAKASLSLAQKELKRAKSLSTSNNIAVQTLNEAETRLRQANAESRLSSIQVERCSIKAPYPGTVTEKLISEGELASPGTALIRLVDTSNIEISAQLRPEQLKSLNTSTSQSFTSNQQALPIALRAVTPVIDPREHTVESRFRFNGLSAITGTLGRVEWKNQGDYLDSTYVQERSGQLGYFVANDGKARFITIENASRGTPPQVDTSSSLPVITTGRFALKDGDAIEVVEAGQ